MGVLASGRGEHGPDRAAGVACRDLKGPLPCTLPSGSSRPCVSRTAAARGRVVDVGIRAFLAHNHLARVLVQVLLHLRYLVCRYRRVAAPAARDARDHGARGRPWRFILDWLGGDACRGWKQAAAAHRRRGRRPVMERPLSPWYLWSGPGPQAAWRRHACRARASASTASPVARRAHLIAMTTNTRLWARREAHSRPSPGRECDP